MRHLVSGRKLKRTSSHRKALLNNLATSLLEHKHIDTTLAKAKELRPFVEHLITKAKHAIIREKQGLLPQGQTIDIHNRRIVGKFLTTKAVLQELFDNIAPTIGDRNGGYTRIIKTGFRYGDGGATARIELVDWSAPQDGAISTKSKRKPSRRSPAPTAKTRKEKNEEIVKSEEVKESEIVATEEIVENIQVEDIVTNEVPVVEEPKVEEVVAEVAPKAEETIATEVVAEAPSEEKTETTSESDKPEVTKE